MKKLFASIISCVMLVSLIGCDIEPLFTVYGEDAQQSVQKFYDNYEILEWYGIEKDGIPTLHYFCIINDMQDGIDVLCVSYKRSDEDRDEYISTEVVISDNVEFGKIYSTEEHLRNIVVEYTICARNDIPKETLQSERFKFNRRTLYLCILSVTDKQ